MRTRRTYEDRRGPMRTRRTYEDLITSKMDLFSFLDFIAAYLLMA
jgi:hypothetical protein